MLLKDLMGQYVFLVLKVIQPSLSNFPPPELVTATTPNSNLEKTVRSHSSSVEYFVTRVKLSLILLRQF